MAEPPDREQNRLSGRLTRYARVGANVARLDATPDFHYADGN